MKRILVWGLSNNRAGTEAVIVNYVTHIKNISFDFLLYEEPKNFQFLFTEENRNRYFVIPMKSKSYLAYFASLHRFMNEHAHEYSALWFNINDVANIDLLAYAKRHGIDHRITHIHNSQTPRNPLMHLFSILNWNRCKRLTTDKWACSQIAGAYLYGAGSDFKIVPNLVDADGRSYSAVKRKIIRKTYNLEDALIVGTVGRLSYQKNPGFLIGLLPALLKTNPDIRLMFVGAGELSDSLKQRATELDVGDAVIFTGSQEDIQGYLSAFDVFAFPSLFEGLPLAFLEAQFNGLPCVTSENITDDAIISTNVKKVALDTPEAWIHPLVGMRRQPKTLIDDLACNYDLKNCGSIASSLFADI